MYARDVQEHHESAGMAGGNEKMQLCATRQLRKKSLSQAAGIQLFTFIIISAAHLPPLFLAAHPYFCSLKQT